MVQVACWVGNVEAVGIAVEAGSVDTTLQTLGFAALSQEFGYDVKMG